jgi:uncharacterized protein YbjT (DUF2867 family)
MITIMGGAGHTGAGVAERLLKAGEKIRVLGRTPEKLQSLKAQGAEVMTGDAADPAHLARAFKGADAVYTLLPPNPASTDFRAEQDRVGEAIATVLRDVGVRHVVFLSSLGAELAGGTGPIAGLHAQEQRLRQLPGTNVLILRPGFFFDNHLGNIGLIKHQGINGGAIGPDVPMVMTSTRDIAAAAADALARRDFKGVVVRELLGKRDRTMREATAILGAAIGKPGLNYVQFSYDDFAAALQGAGFSANMAGLYAEMARAFNEGKIHSMRGRTLDNTTPTALEDFAPVFAAAYKAAP